MDKISYKLPVFEGPLDLLLHLISKNKLNIQDIAVSDLLEQYLAHITAMQEADMDVASEFLEMAARLVHMKTVSLLPARGKRTAQEGTDRAAARIPDGQGNRRASCGAYQWVRPLLPGTKPHPGGQNLSLYP